MNMELAIWPAMKTIWNPKPESLNFMVSALDRLSKMYGKASVRVFFLKSLAHSFRWLKPDVFPRAIKKGDLSFLPFFDGDSGGNLLQWCQVQSREKRHGLQKLELFLPLNLSFLSLQCCPDMEKMTQQGKAKRGLLVLLAVYHQKVNLLRVHCFCWRKANVKFFFWR